jgi:hypothetical protein
MRQRSGEARRSKISKGDADGGSLPKINAFVASWVAHCNPQLFGRELDEAVLQYQSTIQPGCHFLDSESLQRLWKLTQELN